MTAWCLYSPRVVVKNSQGGADAARDESHCFVNDTSSVFVWVL